MFYKQKYLKYKKKYEQLTLVSEVIWIDSDNNIDLTLDHSEESYYPIRSTNYVKIKELSSSASKSGAALAFVETATDNYVLKTINSHEYDILVKMNLINKLKNHTSLPSLISKIYVIFRKKLAGNFLKENYQYWILMENIDYNKTNVLYRDTYNDSIKEWKFDIKGSFLNRKNSNTGVCIDGKCEEGLDRDYLLQTIYIPNLKIPNHRMFKLKLYRDIQFLSENKLIDYSFILKINLKNNQYQYHVGIIDFLQTYTVKKSTEHFMKKLITANSKITIQKPEYYGKRFLNMIYCLIVEDLDENKCENNNLICCNKSNLIKEYQI